MHHFKKIKEDKISLLPDISILGFWEEPFRPEFLRTEYALSFEHLNGSLKTGSW
jgi:hypothetical protein